jgi:hypothetical protein
MYVWLDPQRTSYGFGYGSLWSPAILVHRPAEPSPFASSSLVGTSASDWVLVTIVHNIRKGSSSPPSGRHGRSLTTVLDLPQLLRRAQSAIAFTPHLRLRTGGSYTSEDPGTVATAARRIVATSEGGGHPSRQSRPERRRLFSSFAKHKKFATISSRSCCPWR